jgi:hypothetical protein
MFTDVSEELSSSIMVEAMNQLIELNLLIASSQLLDWFPLRFSR